MRKRRISQLLALLGALMLIASACGSDTSSEEPTGSDEGQSAEETTDEAFEGPLVIGAIPDQDPDLLVRNYDQLASYLSEELGVEVVYEPVIDYEGAVSAFRLGDLDLVWFGGLTGVQARLQVDGAEALAQRDIDNEFTSVFIAGTDTGIAPFDSVDGLSELKGRSLTFGSESSTSGRLMPQSFMAQAGITDADLQGEPGFSGSHDATIELVESGTFEVGALNSQVWYSRVEAGEVDTDKVQLIFETPTYNDYHWVARPELPADLRSDVVAALSELSPDDPEDAELLTFFGAESFIETSNDNYVEIETVGREVGLIED